VSAAAAGADPWTTIGYPLPPERKPVHLVKICVKVLGIGWSRRGS
jgi:hypothetical protein